MKKINTLKSLHLTRYNRNLLMVLRSYGLMVLLLSAFCFLPSLARADKYYYEIKQEYSVLQIENEIASLLYKASYNDTVIVTGSKTNVDKQLDIGISDGKTVLWKANYQVPASYYISKLIEIYSSATSFCTFEVQDGTLIADGAIIIDAHGEVLSVIVSGNSRLQTSGDGAHAIAYDGCIEILSVIVSGNARIQTSGDGAHAITTNGNVEIKDNAYLSSTTGETIESNGDNAVVNVTGGTICATIENAIITNGKNTKINISGGHVFHNNNDSDIYPVVLARDQSYSSLTLIHVSGDALVEAKGMGAAISSKGSVIVSGNAQVRNAKGGQNNIPTINSHYSVLVTDSAKVTAFVNDAIHCPNGNVTLYDNSIVEAKEDAIAIFSSSCAINDQAQVIAANNYAISFDGGFGHVALNGGLAFAYGKGISHVINTGNTTFGYESSSVVLAWDKEAGNTNYDRFSRDDIFILPESATAYWDSKADKQGIYYENGENSGFIPLDVNVLSVNEPNLPNIEVYPNPTNGEFRITNHELRITDVEVFDVYGRKVLEPPLTVLRSYDLTVLPAGIYFVKITTEKGVVTKKVIKL